MKKLTIATMIMSLIAISAIIFNVVNNVEDIERLTTFNNLDYSTTEVELSVTEVENILAAEHALKVKEELNLPEPFEDSDEALKQIQDIINYWGYDEENKYYPAYGVIMISYYDGYNEGTHLFVAGSIAAYHSIPFSFSLNYSEEGEVQTFEEALKKLKLDEESAMEEIDRIIAIKLEEGSKLSNPMIAASITDPVEYIVTEDDLIVIYNTDYSAGGATYSERVLIPLDYLKKIAK